MRIGGGQDKLQILRGLLQGLQNRVERVIAEHMHLINHENLKSPSDWLVDGLFDEILDLFNTTVRGGIQFRVVHKTTDIDGQAVLTKATRLGRDAFLAVERLGQNSRYRGFANTPGSREQVRMVQPLSSQRIRQSLHHMRLPHQFGEGLWTILSG